MGLLILIISITSVLMKFSRFLSPSSVRDSHAATIFSSYLQVCTYIAVESLLRCNKI